MSRKLSRFKEGNTEQRGLRGLRGLRRGWVLRDGKACDWSDLECVQAARLPGFKARGEVVNLARQVKSSEE